MTTTTTTTDTTFTDKTTTYTTDSSFITYIDRIWDVFFTDSQHEVDELIELAHHERLLLDSNCEVMLAEFKVIEAFRLSRRDAFIEGLKLAKEAYSVFFEQCYPRGLVRVFRVLSFIYGQIGQLNECFRVIQDALELIKQNGLELTEEGGTPVAFVLLNNMATLTLHLGRVNEALQYYLEAMELVKVTSPRSYVLVSCNIASTCLKLGEAGRAMPYIQESLAIVEREHLGPYYSHLVYLALGLALKSDLDFSQALSTLERALADAEQLDSKIAYIETLLEIAELHMSVNAYELAFSFYERSETIAKLINTQAYLRDIYKGLASCCEAQENSVQALAYYKRYMLLYEHVADDEFEAKLTAFTTEYRVERAQKDADFQRLKAEALEEAHRNLSFLSEIGRKLTASLEVEEVFSEIYDNLSRLMLVNAFAIAFYDEASQTLEFKLLIEEGVRLTAGKVDLKVVTGYAAECIFKKEPLLLNSLSDVNAPAKLSTLNIPDEQYSKSAIYFPLMFEDQVMGIITVQSYLENAYSEQELEIIKILGAYFVIALNNSQKSEALTDAVKRLEVVAITDHLTSLYNRRYMMRQLESAYEAYLRYGHSFAVMITDIDRFKFINDTYGHDCGDEVLKKISQLFTRTLRNLDNVARWGGEEFFFLLPQTTQETAFHLAERLRQTVAQTAFSCQDKSIKVTLTFGIATFTHGLTIEEVIKRADRSLYHGKKYGRNMTVLYDSMIIGDVIE